jgi:hypothetical protein
VFYNWWVIGEWLKYDQVVHAYGFGLTTWLCWTGLRVAAEAQGAGPLHPTPGLMVLCAAAGNGFGAFNEIVEFTATLLLPKTNVGSYENTAWDLVFNALGSVLAVVAIMTYHARHRGETVPEA